MAAVSSVAGSTSSAPSARSATTGTSGSPTLSQGDFFKLLLAQLQNQSPLDPVSSTDFVSQLSQFSTVQGIQQLNTNLSSFIAAQGLSQAASLIGKPITYDPGNGNLVAGSVDSVSVGVNGNVQLMVGGKAVAINQVRSVNSVKTTT